MQLKKYGKQKRQREDMTFTVMGRELQMEDLVKKEEKAKIEQKTTTIEQKIVNEERKWEMIQRQIQEKEIDEEFRESKKDQEVEFEQEKQRFAKKIINTRNTLKKNLKQIDRKGKNKQAELESKLQKVKTKMSKEIMLANRNGNKGVCMKGFNNEQYRTEYCDRAFSDSWTQNSECKGEDFCTIWKSR